MEVNFRIPSGPVAEWSSDPQGEKRLKIGQDGPADNDENGPVENDSDGFITA